jgi:hypothetical protein
MAGVVPPCLNNGRNFFSHSRRLLLVRKEHGGKS